MKAKIEFDEDKVLEHFENVLFKTVLKLHSTALRNAPSGATNELRSKIDFFPKSRGHHKYKVISQANHSAAVEFGTKPHWTSVENLKAWARRKLGDENAAYAIQRKIAKFGTDRHPFMVPALMEVKNIWLPRFAQEKFI